MLCASYQVLKLDIQVLANGKLGVGDGLMQVGIQIMKHLNERGVASVISQGPLSSCSKTTLCVIHKSGQ